MQTIKMWGDRNRTVVRGGKRQRFDATNTIRNHETLRSGKSPKFCWRKEQRTTGLTAKKRGGIKSTKGGGKKALSLKQRGTPKEGKKKTP